jgi:hypothetical protein
MKGYEYIGNLHTFLMMTVSISLSKVSILISTFFFSGHFIVLINYDPNEDVFIYRDPAQQDKVCVIQADILDSARQSIGTDNDW